MPSINVQGVGTVNFPDNMSHADIVKAIEKDILPKYGKPAEPEGSDFVRGFENYLPQTKESYGAAKVLAGKAIGSDALMKSGLNTMEEAKQALRAKSKSTDSFTEALDKGMGAVLTDWLPYQIGSGAANILESLAVMGAGAAAGSVIPGYGTAVGGALGLVEKELVKTGVKKLAKEILEKEGEEVAKKFVEEKTAAAAKKVARDVAATSALAAQAGFHGAGETTSRAVEEAQRLGKEATDIEMGRVVPAAIVHGVAEFIGDKIGLGAFNKLDLNQKNLLLNFGKNLVVTGTKEAPVEVIQSTAERYGARLSLSDAEAIKEYVDSAAAAYAMSIVPAAGGAVKTRGMAGIEEKSQQLQEQFRQDAEQQMESGVVDSQKAEAEAQKIGTTAVPDAQGNVQSVSFEPISDATAVDKGLQTAAAMVANEEQKAEIAAAKGKEEIAQLVGNAYAEHSSGKKVLDALKPQLEAMGITDVKEQKAIIEEARQSLNIPTGNTKEGRAAKKVWQQQWKDNQNAKQSSQTVGGGSESGATSPVSTVGESTGEATTSDVYGVDLTGGTTSATDSTAAEQRAALDYGSLPSQQLIDIYEDLTNTYEQYKAAKTELDRRGEFAPIRIAELERILNNPNLSAKERALFESELSQLKENRVTEEARLAEQEAAAEQRAALKETKSDRPEIVQQRATLERVLPKTIGGYTLGAITPYAGNWTVNYTLTNENGMVFSTNVPIDAEMLEGKTDAEIETAIRERAAKNGLREPIKPAAPPKRTIKLEEDKAAPVEQHTPDQAAYLGMKTSTRAAPATSIKEGMGYAAAESAFDFYDSAYSNIERALKDRVKQENDARDAAYNEAKKAKKRGEKIPKPEKITALDILQKMPEVELINLFKKNVNEKKLTDERRAQMEARTKFINSLTEEQQKAVRNQAIELFQREIKAVKNIGRTTTESDQRKNREQAAEEAVKKLLESVEKPSRKVTPSKQKTGPTQIETLEQKRDAAIKKALESGEVDRLFAAISNDKINDSITAYFAKKIHDVLKSLGLSSVKKSIENKLAAWEKHNNKNYEAARKDVDAAEKYRRQNSDKKTPENLLVAEKNAKAVIKEYEAERERLINELPEGTTQYPTIVLGKVEDGHPGKYDPSTETITIDLNNLGKERLDIVALHELMHYVADHVVDNRKNLTREQQNALNRLDNLYRYVNSKLGKKFDISNLKEFIAQSFSNPEFQKAMGNLSPMETEGKKQNIFSLFAKRVMELLGFRNRMLSREEIEEAGGTYGAVLGDVLTQIEQIIKVERTAPAVGVSYMSKQAAPIQNRSLEEMKSEQKTGKSTAAPKRLYNAMLSGKLGNWAETTFVNDRAPLKRWQEKLSYAGRVIAYGVGMNNIYDQIVLSSGNAHWMYTQYVQTLNEDIRQDVAAYAKKKGLSVEEALQELSLYAVYRHMQERRETLYMKKVKLSDAPIIKYTDAKGNISNISPAAMREEIFKLLNTNEKLTDAEIASLDKALRNIVFDKNNTYLSPDVIGKDASNINSTSFDVAGTYTAQEIAEIKKDYDKNKADVDPIFKTVKQLNNTILKLNKMSNRMSKYAENWIKFYGWENYVPLKGKNVSEEAELLNLDSRRLGGELQDAVYTFQGNHQIPDNPILQVMADGALAAMYVSLNNVTESIYNSSKYSKDKNPNGSGVLPTAEVDQIINFEQRQDNKFVQSLGGETKVFHYMPDGKVAIISIKDKQLLESIRRSYREINSMVDFLNKATGFFGQLHTRFNIAFAPVNFVRDVLTNAFTMGAELGPKAAFDYIASVAKGIVTRGMFKTLNFNRLYSKGNIAEIERLAAADKSGYYQAIMDYVKTGGRVSYLAGIANKGQFDELYKEAGPGRVLVGKKITKFFDGWIDMFEVAARVSAFKVAKETAMGEASREGRKGPDVEKEATVRGAAYAKNLANFEQVGQWGKALGAFYMFFRPSATGAVRALDALMPAFMDAQQARIRQPDFVVAAAARKELQDKSIKGDARTKLEAQLKDAEKALDKFDKTFAERKQNAKIVSMALMGVGFVVYQMAKSAADDDDLGRNKVATDDMSRWTKFARFYIPGYEQPFQLPWGFGLGSFAAMGAQMAAMLGGNTRVGDSLANMLTITLDSFLPLPVSRISPAEKPLEFAIDSTLPSIVRPLVEYVMNVDALGRQIYNNRQSRYGDAYTGGDSVPEAYKMAARYLVEATNGDINITPNTLYFFANSYADGASRLMHNGINIGLWLAGEKDFNPKTDTLILDSFVGTKSNFDAREWQRVENDLKEREKRINMFENKPEQYANYLAAHPLDQMLVNMYNHDANGYLKDLREDANKYRDMPGLSPKDRKQIVDTIIQQENFEKYRLIELYKAIGVNP